MSRPFVATMVAAGGLPFLSALIPNWGGLFLLFVPAPYILFGYLLQKSQLMVVLGVCSLPFVLYTIGLSKWNLLLVNIQLILTAIAVGLFMRRSFHPFKAIFSAVLIMALLEGVIFLWVSHQKGISPNNMIGRYLDYQLKDGGGVVGLEPGRQDYEAALLQLKEILRKIYPSMVVIVGALLGLMNLALSHLIFARSMGLKLIEYQELTSWRPKQEAMWVFIASGFGTLLLEGIAATFSLNLLLVVLCVYFFQGIGVIAWWMERAKMANWIRAIIFISIGLQQFFLFLVSFLGIIDNWVDFRKLKGQGERR